MLWACVAMCACSNDSFTIEGVLTDVGERTVRAVYVNEAGVQSVTVVPEGGRFKITGVSPNYTVVYVYNQQNAVITKVVMKNGDDLKLKGTIRHNYLIEMKGEDVNEEWNEFRRENHVLYAENREEELNEKIEDYVKANPDKMASVALLINDYSLLDDSKKVHELLEGINEEVRHASLLKAYSDVNGEMPENDEDEKRIWTSIKFYNQNDSIKELKPDAGKMSVLYFWRTTDESHKEIVEELDSLYYNYMRTSKGKKQIQIADVVLDSDTVAWKRVVRNEDKDWQHFWAVGGHMNPTVSEMGVVKSAYFKVIDSMGHVVYSGDSISSVSDLVKEKLEEMSDKETVKEREKKNKAQEKRREEMRKKRQKIFEESQQKKKKSKLKK